MSLKTPKIKIPNLRNPGSAFMLFVVVFYLGMVLVRDILFSVLSNRGVNMDAIPTPLILIFSQVFGLVLPFVLWIIFTGDSFKRNLPSEKLDRTNIKYIVQLSFLIQPAMMALSAISTIFAPNIAGEVITAFMAYPFWLLVLAIAITPSICEELVFRGYIQTNTPGKKIRDIAIMNGLFFAIIHMHPQQFFYTFALGVLFAYMVYYTKNILSVMLAHFIINGTQLTFATGALWLADAMERIAESLPYLQEGMADFLETRFGITNVIEITDAAAVSMDAELTVESIISTIVVFGVVLGVTSYFAVKIFKKFVAYNRPEINDEVVAASEKKGLRTIMRNFFMGDPEEDCENEMAGGVRIDWCLIAVAVIYVVFVFVLPHVL